MTTIRKKPEPVNTLLDPGLQHVYNKEKETFTSPLGSQFDANNIVIEQITQIVTNVIQRGLPTSGNGQLQFNENGDFASDGELTYDPITDTLTTGTLIIDEIQATTNGLVSLGRIQQLKVQGGNYNEVLRTDGLGNLSFVPVLPSANGNAGKSLTVTANTYGWKYVEYGDLANIPNNIATTSYVDSSINNLLDNAPAALNTLKELATALDNNASYASSISNQLAAKVNTVALSTVAFTGNYTSLTDKPDLTTYATTSNLSILSNTVANITWANLSGKPTIPTDIANLTDTTNLLAGIGNGFSGNYNDLTNKPNLSVYATTANLSTLSNTVANITYANLSDAPNISNYATNSNVSNLSNTVANITWANLSGAPNISNYATNSNVSNLSNTVANITYANLSGKPTLGNISSIDKDGNSSNILYGNGVFAAAPAGGASTGNWEFRNDTIYNYAGGQINNSDTAHGATAGLTLPDNGRTDPGAVTTLFNNYGNVVLTSGEFVTTDNTIGSNGSQFYTDINIGGGFGVIDGWRQRNPQQIEVNIFTAQAPIWSVLIGASLGATVIVTYSTPSGNQTFTSVLSQQFTGQGQYDPGHDYGQRYSGRIDGTLPAGQTGIVSINFPTSSVTNKNWTFDNDGNLTLPTNTAKINYANGVSILDGISGGASTGNITFDGDNIGSSNDVVNIVGNNYAQLESNENYIWVEETYAAIAVNDYEWTFHDDAVLTIANGANISQTTDNGGQKTFNITPPDTSDFEVVTVDGNIRLQTANSDGGPTVTSTWTFDKGGNLSLPQGTILSETANSTTITPPNALAGQGLVVRLTGAQGISSDHPGGFTDGDTITIAIIPDYNLTPVTGTVDYTFTDCTQQQLGRALTGTLTFTSEPSKLITWTIPVSSTMTTFTITLSNASGFDISLISPLTLTSTGSSEDHHIHLIAGDPSITDIYLGDDDQYVKIEKNGGNVVIGTDTNSKRWIFDTSGGLTLPGDFYIGSGEGSLGITSPDAVAIIANQGNTDHAWLFNTDGNLTLPHGGVISEIPDTVTLSGTQTDGSMNATYTRSKYNNNYYVLGGSNWSIRDDSGTYRLRYATDSSNYMYSSDLITWILGPAFSGDIETPSTGAPTIGSTKITSKDKTWSFGTGGNLTLPTNTSKINYANGTSILSGLGGGGIALTDLSIGTDGTPTGGGNVSYNNTTGVFTYTPPVIPDVSGFALTSDIPDVSGFVTGTPWTSEGYLTTITNIFDQDLNTANNVTFNSIITSNVQATNGVSAVIGYTTGTAGAPLTIGAGDGGTAATGWNAGAGGNLTITAGDAGSDIGNPSWGEIGGTLVIRGGNSSRPYHGSDVQIHSGNAVTSPGAISLYTGTNQWTFGKTGNLTLPVGGNILDSTGNSVLGVNIFNQNLNTSNNVTFNSVTTDDLQASTGANLTIAGGQGTPIPKSIVLNGTSGYMTIPSSPDWIMGKTWTFEFRIKMNATSVGTGVPWRLITQEQDNAVECYMGITISGGELSILCTQSNSLYFTEPTPGQWVHVAVVNNNVGPVVYYNGVVQTYTQGYGGPANYTSSNAITIGRFPNNDYQYFPGEITGIRISDVVRYTQNFTPTTETFDIDSNLLLLMNVLDGQEYTDSSSYNRTISNYNTTLGTIPGIGLLPGNLVASAGSQSWTFSTDGNLTLSNSATIIAPSSNDLTVRVTGQYNICTVLTGGSGYGGGGSSSAVSGGSGTGMIVGYGYGLSGQVSNLGVTTPGTGYQDGDVLTMTAGNGDATFVITKYNTAANAGNNNTAPSDWIFDTTNNLTLPLGGDIKDSTGATKYIGVSTLKTLVADSTDFADFQARISAL